MGRSGHEHLALEMSRRMPFRVAVSCALVTSITYCLYKVYLDSMLRQKDSDKDEKVKVKAHAEKERNDKLDKLGHLASSSKRA